MEVNFVNWPFNREKHASKLFKSAFPPHVQQGIP